MGPPPVETPAGKERGLSYDQNLGLVWASRNERHGS